MSVVVREKVNRAMKYIARISGYLSASRFNRKVQKLLVLLCAASCLTMQPVEPVKPLPHVMSDCKGAVELMFKFDLRFPILFIGKYADTVGIPCGSVPMGEERIVEREDFFGKGWHTTTLFIDTSQLISGLNYCYTDYPNKVLENVETKSYPVFFINGSEGRNDLITYMPLYLEYMDSSGVWQQAQNNDFYYCLSFPPIIRFDAGEMIISRFPVFGTGKMYRLRISAGIGEEAAHSNEIYARAIIDESRW